MAFDPVLMIMQPRHIDEAINSLKENIDIPKVWFRAYTEPQVMAQMNKFIKDQVSQLKPSATLAINEETNRLKKG